VWKYHYTPGPHEMSSVGEVIFNTEVWASLTPQQQEAIRSASSEVFVRWWIKWQKQNADAIEEMQTKHGTQILRYAPGDPDRVLQGLGRDRPGGDGGHPFFKKVYESQKAYAAKVVPAKRFMCPALLVRGELLLPAASR
jgi:TRAP-type mannitol/chloroaromatic compound transport system substrate-binding protein